VDLNRNYDFHFNNSELSSSSNPCEETYRGKNAFSEPETLAVHNFIEKNPEIKIAYNYHSYGNFFIFPFSFLNEKSFDYLQEKFNYFYRLYKEFEKENIFPVNNKFGNDINLLNYSSDGEASDWMLGQKGILAFSPELGNSDYNSETFYPNKITAFDICRENLSSAIFGIQKSGYSLKFNGMRSFNNKNESEIDNKKFNNPNNYFWAYCEDLTKNTHLINITQNEYDYIYQNGLLNEGCEKDNQKFYSISILIDNEGLQGFNYEASLNLNLKSIGVKKIIGNVIKLDYSKFSIVKLSDNFEYNFHDNSFSNSSNLNFLYDKNKTNFLKQYFPINKLESNNSILLDLKIFEDIDYLDNESLVIDLKIEFNYEAKNKTVRNFSINDLTVKDFQYFNSDKNRIIEKILYNCSLKNYIILNADDERKSFKKTVVISLSIVIPILIISILFVLIIKYKKRKINKKEENKTENILEASHKQTDKKNSRLDKAINENNNDSISILFTGAQLSDKNLKNCVKLISYSQTVVNTETNEEYIVIQK